MNPNIGANIGLSLFAITVGAILTWAVEATVAGLNIAAVGVILMVAGLAGLGLSWFFWSSYAPRRRTEIVETHEFVEHHEPPLPR